MGGEAPVDSATDAVNACLASLKVSRGGHDLLYGLGVKFLVSAWRKTYGCSPLARWEEFQEFCAPVVNEHGAPIPSKRQVRRWLP